MLFAAFGTPALRVLRSVVRHVFAASVLSLLSAAALAYAQDHAPLLDRPAEPWNVEHWINSPPLELSELRGRVVLVRFWTAPGCRFCRATAPALNDFHARYAARGLRVIGFYHHKSSAPLSAADVQRHAHAFGFRFPVAIDPEWRTLRAWWLSRTDHRFTSVSFLIDRRGVIRHIHPGGQYVRGEPDYARLEDTIEKLLDERP